MFGLGTKTDEQKKKIDKRLKNASGKSPATDSWDFLKEKKKTITDPKELERFYDGFR